MVPGNSNKRELGSDGEELAVAFLKENGYSILSRNYRVGRHGEIDIIALNNEYICFIEVKTRRSTLFGTPSESVNRKKQKNIVKLACMYLNRHGLHQRNIRFDVVEVYMNSSVSAKTEIELIKNAFS